MSKRDFSAKEFASRHARVRAAMAQAGIDVLAVIHPANINWLIGARHKAYQEFQCLFVPLEDRPFTMLTRLAEWWEVKRESLCEDVRGWGGREPGDPIAEFKKIIDEKGWSRRRIGLEVPRYYISVREYAAIRDAIGPVVDATRLIETLKWVKSPAELAYIKKAAGFADAAMKALLKAAKPGKTEHQLAAEAYRVMMGLGGDVPASPINLAFGERTAYAHGLPTERKLKRGDYVQVEFGGAYKRYCSTIGRQAVMGKPNKRQKELYDVVREACDACIAEIRDGVPAVTPHRAAKRVIAKAGFDEYRVHTTGYGIAPGFPPVWGESLDMFEGSRDVLKAGMVVSIEPPLFKWDEGLGARIIDNVLVTQKGCKILSKVKRDLIVL
jgi:Xaa-Pro dipeptidase